MKTYWSIETFRKRAVLPRGQEETEETEADYKNVESSTTADTSTILVTVARKTAKAPLGHTGRANRKRN